MTQSPLLGFNNNVKHRGKLFHIQTEDSGVRHPHVITHLFMDGGRILKTIKTSYAEHVGSDKMQQVVRELMKEQHKMMFIALRDGQFDHVLDSVPPPSMSGPPVHPSIPVSARLPDTTSLPPNSVVSTAPDKGASVPAARASSTQAMPAVQAVAGAAIPSKTPSSTGAQKPPAVAASKAPAVAPAMTSPPVRPPSGTMPAAQKPAASGAPGPATGVRPVPRREAPDLFGSPAPETAVANVVAEPGAAPAAAASGAKKEQPGSGRYAASRPAAIFTSGRNADAGGSIFGDDLISEKSLDEVILSYLSDDLETPKK